MRAVLETQLADLKLKARGKVRDIYDLGDHLLIISTDRISAFDCILPTPIPGKGKVLTHLSAFWFSLLREIVPNHLITTDIAQMPGLQAHCEILEGRSMLCRKAIVFPIECVARGYLMGSGWKEYREKNRKVCGIELPPGLINGQKLPEVIFTPATKNNHGHDENVSFEYAVARLVEALRIPLDQARHYMAKLKELTIKLYSEAYKHALERGIIIADTKFEFGLVDGQITLIDEALTPDSSRFWPRDQYTPGKVQLSFDKQFVRDYLEGIGFNKQPPAPELPENVVNKTSEKYLEAFRLITGQTLIS